MAVIAQNRFDGFQRLEFHQIAQGHKTGSPDTDGQFFDLFMINRALQDDFPGSEIARFIRTG